MAKKLTKGCREAVAYLRKRLADSYSGKSQLALLDGIADGAKPKCKPSAKNYEATMAAVDALVDAEFGIVTIEKATTFAQDLRPKGDKPTEPTAKEPPAEDPTGADGDGSEDGAAKIDEGVQDDNGVADPDADPEEAPEPMAEFPKGWKKADYQAACKDRGINFLDPETTVAELKALLKGE